MTPEDRALLITAVQSIATMTAEHAAMREDITEIKENQRAMWDSYTAISATQAKIGTKLTRWESFAAGVLFVLGPLGILLVWLLPKLGIYLSPNVFHALWPNNTTP